MLQKCRHQGQQTDVAIRRPQQLRMVFEVGDREIPLPEVIFLHHTEVERNARVDTVDHEFAKRSFHTSDGCRSGGGMYDELS